MSRIGKKPIKLQSGVSAEIKSGTFKVTGPKGSLEIAVHPKVSVSIADGQVTVDVKNHDNKTEKALWGLTRSLLANAVNGVVSGYEKKLEINGVGFRGSVAGSKINLSLGFSHPVEVEVPKGLSATIEKNIITVSGIDKQQVGEFAANIRALKKPEPYKGKGIKYVDEVIRRKAGKVVKAVGGAK
ncbi:50S ribosomal protein L6 [Patescibacteria group bacterium]|nr:50S ribosomal protein L6 [Patescibacteria group bacterium]